MLLLRRDYTAFGIELQSSGPSNPFRYCGEYYDTELDSVYLRNRYYNPSTGRFLTEDPIKDGMNWYSYCGSDPVFYTDSFGLDKILDDYIKANYAGKMTVTICIERPVPNSRAVATVEDGILENGHTFLRLDNVNRYVNRYVNYIGFAPQVKSLFAMMLSEDVGGMLINDDKSEWNVAQVFHITPDSYELINKYINNAAKNMPNYNIETYNCTTFAIGALKDGGLVDRYLRIYPHNWTLPRKLVHQLENYSARPEKLSPILAAGGIIALMGNNFGYTPADAAQDLKENKGKVLLHYDSSIRVLNN